MKKYTTSPIYYVNDVPHIGHAYTSILCDMFKRYERLKGGECVLLTGTDEHGQKIENSAKAKQKPTKAYADEISARFRALWDAFGLDYDYFVRTTDDYHEKGVQWAFERMFEKGDIYKGHYEGNYCVSCETFFTKRQLVDELYCPDCGKETAPLKEESYFFALSRYEKRLLAWYEDCPEVIAPSHKKNEVVRFVEGGLSDLSITRSGFKWGIPLPKSLNDDKHIMYVWLDALLSYLTPLGLGNERPDKMALFENATHFVGKDILRFHAVYWPAFLMSLGLPLPRHIYAHGWWTVNGVKMSKSIGNVVNPFEVANAYGLEVLRYFLVREVPFGQDGDFNERTLIERANSDLSDNLGNLLARLLGMSEKYFALRLESSAINAPSCFLSAEKTEVDSIFKSLEFLMDKMLPHRYLEELWRVFALANLCITKYEPWAMMKKGEDSAVATLLVFIANALAKGALALYPILPKTALEMTKSLGISLENYEHFIKNGAWSEGFALTKVAPLFPKIEPKNDESSAQNAPQDAANLANPRERIDIKQFEKLDIRVGRILSAKPLEKSDKLLLLGVDFGAFSLQIISSLAKSYSSEELANRLVCAIINLKPSKILGEISEGMILTTQDSRGAARLLSVEEGVSVGAKIN